MTLMFFALMACGSTSPKRAREDGDGRCSGTLCGGCVGADPRPREGGGGPEVGGPRGRGRGQHRAQVRRMRTLDGWGSRSRAGRQRDDPPPLRIDVQGVLQQGSRRKCCSASELSFAQIRRSWRSYDQPPLYEWTGGGHHACAPRSRRSCAHDTIFARAADGEPGRLRRDQGRHRSRPSFLGIPASRSMVMATATATADHRFLPVHPWSLPSVRFMREHQSRRVPGTRGRAEPR